MSHFTPNSGPYTVVGLGEALFDCFGERTVLGGAPVNLAVHANQLLCHAHCRGVVASAIGSDPLGERLQKELAARGMTTDYLTVVPEVPTGTVQVTVDVAGHPQYEITENVAWDGIEFTDSLAQLAKSCSAVCFGTLAQRAPISRKSIQHFLASAKNALRVCDINLRQQFFTAEVIESSLQAANVVKLNEEELSVIGELLKLESRELPVDDQIAGLQRRFDLSVVAFTRGEAGTVLYSGDERVEGEVPKYLRQPQADSVGAGDSCCAALIVGLLLGKPLGEIVTLANRVGAFVASVQGATPELPAEILELVGR
ncbi:PfkB family carbohydrate kinase [Bythopirellula polymerisocia]|uniref:2-dehydro-3-deoxygluconokinase n=1 Tax=Bythopirellula polymerisocia TaxID=2528003 RepID=A0A5C6CXU3_9BACT|nr:PfkB family carbohydrate kinase [Bythopirellula polymerisocia]TWU29422.1 2-dehydro-3-deoxygluconokinase [Bythopirellula polymerisocia]